MSQLSLFSEIEPYQGATITKKCLADKYQVDIRVIKNHLLPNKELFPALFHNNLQYIPPTEIGRIVQHYGQWYNK